MRPAFSLVTNESRKALTHPGCFRMQSFQAHNDIENFTGAQIFGELLHPAIRLRRIIAVAQTGECPCVFQRMPKIENLTAADKPCVVNLQASAGGTPAPPPAPGA